METFSNIIKSSSGQTMLYSIGQAGFIIKSRSGQSLGIDLYLSDCVEKVEGHVGYHRLLPRLVDPEDLQLDILVATHFHRDHLDVESLPAIMKKGKTFLCCSFDCAKDIDDLRIDKNRVLFIKPGDKISKGDFDLTFIRCDHGNAAPQAVGVIVKTDGKTILETGDTCLHTDWKEEYLSQGPIDILIAPINGAYGNLNEQDNIKLTQALQPRLTVPCHFGMFASHGGHPGLWKDMLDTQLPEQKYKIFTQGEGIII